MLQKIINTNNIDCQFLIEKINYKISKTEKNIPMSFDKSAQGTDQSTNNYYYS